MDYNIPVEELQRTKRADRYRLQDISATLANNNTGHAVARCMRSVKSGSVTLVKNTTNNKAYYRGLLTCGSVWDCPVCSAKISISRSEEIKKALDFWADQGGSVVLVTYTLSHNKGHKLGDLAKVVTNAIRYVHSGAPYARVKSRLGIVGTLSSTEVLYNEVNGWHYHKHQLLFLKHSPRDINKLRHWLYARYEKYLEDKGYYSAPGIGVDVRQGDTESIINEYMSKWGLERELISQDKNNSSGLLPFNLLDRPEYHNKFIEYSLAMFGKKRLTWSRGLRAMMGLDVEKSDQELAEEIEAIESVTQVIKTISYQDWKYILSKRLRSEILDRVERDPGGFDNWYQLTISEFK